VIEPFRFDGFDGVRAVVTTRAGGVSTGPYASLNLGAHVGDDPAAVRQNRDRVAAALGVAALTVADQQHTATAAVVTPELAGRGHAGAEDSRAAFPATDALVSDVPGAALGVLVADCTPLVLWDPVHRAAAVAHCGRPGVIAGVVPATLDLMRRTYDTDPADLLAGVGPGVCQESYEVSDVEADAMEAAFPGGGFTEPTRPGHHLLDIPAAVRHQLRTAGVPDDRVHHMDVDTHTHTDTFFSDRAERPCGRFMAVVVVPARG